ncbi:MAG TPA: hypothetical protein VFD84_08245 [Candidatus Binatia bacterium]|nr:hypothetical protein [Candidatus Binatia bacterium]
MNSAFSVGDQVTDALGEVVLDLPTRRRWTREIGELRLMAAVLEDAVNVLRKRPRSRAGREAREWMASRDTTWPFSYERICEALDLDPNTVRREVSMKKVVRIPVTSFDLPLAQTA